MAALQPDKMAIAWPDGRGGFLECTFGELDDDSSRIAAALAMVGIARGTRTVVMVPPGLDLFALTFGLFKAGVVPVMVDPGMGLKSLKKCLAEAEPEAFIGVPKAHAARVLLGWGRATIRSLVTVGPRIFWGGATLAQLRRSAPVHADRGPIDPEQGEVAAILFTSGSTGVPKGVVYTHANFVAQVERLRETYGIEPGEVDLPTFPLFALFDPALGMSAVIPEMDPTRPANVDPEKILGAIRRYGVTNTFGSPALLHRVGSYGAARGVQLPTLRRVISAGAPVHPTVLDTFAKLLPPGTEIHTAYGATESLPVSSLGSDTILAETAAKTHRGMGVCVGHPTPQMEVRIIKIDEAAIETWSDDLVVPRGTVGEVTVRGPVVTRSYYGRELATRQAKIIDPSGGFWHRMGDVGYQDESGRLWFCGRKAHRVVLADTTLFTVQCEGVFNAHPDVYRTALVGVRRAGQVQPVICVERLPGRATDNAKTDNAKVEAGLRELAQANGLTQRIDTFLFHPAFPVDIRHNAKIFREKLAVWAAGQLS